MERACRKKALRKCLWLNSNMKWITAPSPGSALKNASRQGADVCKRTEVHKMQKAVYKTQQKGKNSEPSKKQKTYILTLARMAGVRVDIARVTSRAKASEVIEKLKGMNSKPVALPVTNTATNVDEREKRIAFGLATKLMFRRYSDHNWNPASDKDFWNDVAKLYSAYLTNQAQFTNGKTAEGVV